MKPIRYRCNLHAWSITVIFGLLAVAYLIMTLLALPDADGCTIAFFAAVMLGCAALAGMGVWSAQWLLEITKAGICVRHPWSGKQATLPWQEASSVQRVYQKAEHLLVTAVPMNETEALRVWKKTCAPSHAGAVPGCICFRVANQAQMEEITACLVANGLTVPRKAIKGPWQL